VSLAANAKGVGLSFYYGPRCRSAQNSVGSGNQNRFIRLESAATLAGRVQDLIGAAVRQAKTPLAGNGRRIHRHQIHFANNGRADCRPNKVGSTAQIDCSNRGRGGVGCDILPASHEQL